MNKVYLLLGGNLGDRTTNLQNGILLIEKYIGSILQKSSVYETSPWGFEHKNWFLNQAIEVETKLNPEEILTGLHAIEQSLGRIRHAEHQWNERIMDIDILLFNNEAIQVNDLTIPHRYLHKRKFALAPLNEIAGDVMHPLMHKSIHQLLQECEDNENTVQLFAI